MKETVKPSAHLPRCAFRDGEGLLAATGRTAPHLPISLNPKIKCVTA